MQDYQTLLSIHKDTIIDCLGGLDNIIDVFLNSPNAPNTIDSTKLRKLKQLLHPHKNDKFELILQNSSSDTNTQYLSQRTKYIKGS